MKNVKYNGYFGNKNAYKGDNISLDMNRVCELRETLSWEKISQELGIPRTTLMRRVKQWLEHEKSLGYEIEI